MDDDFGPAHDCLGSQGGMERETPDDFVLGKETLLALRLLGPIELFPTPANGERVFDRIRAVRLKMTFSEDSRDLYEFILCTLNRRVRKLECFIHLFSDFFSDIVLVGLFSSILRGLG